MGSSDSGGGGSAPNLVTERKRPVGVTFSNNTISPSTRKDKQRRGGRPVDALAQPMAGSKSADPYSVGAKTSYKSTESESGIGFRTDESGQQYAVRIDRATGKTPSYAKSGKPSTGDRVDYSKALEVERRFKSGEVMSDAQLDTLFGMQDDSSDTAGVGSATEDKSQPIEGTDLSKAARRAQAQAQKGVKSRTFYDNRRSGLS